MEFASIVMAQEQLRCAICLDVFTEPITTPCGHNYCKTCITQYWDTAGVCHCPYCTKKFLRRPEIVVNTFISEMAAQFRTSRRVLPAEPHEVSCDVCVDIKPKALKSCLVCLTSYCEAHLEPHGRVATLKRHKLIDPAKNLEDFLCKKHDRPLELFCKTDCVCVCQFCCESECRLHQTLSLEEGVLLLEAEVQQMIQDRQTKIQEAKHSIELVEKDIESGIEDSVQSITALSGRTTVAQLDQIIRQEIERLHSAELSKIKQYAMDVTFDPDTANRYLILHDDGKQVTSGKVPQDPQNKESEKRFSSNNRVLGKQSISSGRFYYEVQVKGKTSWDLGVARETIDMKKKVKLGPDSGYWAIWLRNGKEYKAYNNPSVDLHVGNELQKVGVFVDYEEGLVSFYDAEASALLYSFTDCTFKGKLYPYFYTAASLIISPVSEKDDISYKCVQAITALKSCIEKKRKHKPTEKQAKGFIKELEKEITVLEKRNSQLKHIEGQHHLHLLQNLTSAKDWTMAHGHQSYGGTLGITAPQLEKTQSYGGTLGITASQLEKTLSLEMKKLYEAEEQRNPLNTAPAAGKKKLRR